MYPNPSQFTVMLSQTGKKSNAIEAYDPIASAYPSFPTPPLSPPLTDPAPINLNTVVAYDAGLLTIELGELVFPLSNVDNYYINNYIEIVDTASPYPTIEFRKIVAYNSTTKTITIESALAADPTGDFYRIRLSTPLESGVLTGGTATTFTLPLSASTVDNFYVGQFIWVKAGINVSDPIGSDVRIITQYDGATRTGTVNSTFTTAVPAVDILYEILHFTDDNVSPLVFTGSAVSQKQTTCYEIELISLILPNALLKSGHGNRIAFYPYVYVEFSNVSSAGGQGRNVIYSNNPNASRALFIAPIDDISQPVNSTFVSIDSHGMVETVKFKPNDNFRFSVFLPNGELFLTDPDTGSPLPPNPDLQISAIFSIRKLG
jgi:hypothetical protein